MELKKFQDQFESREVINQFYSYKSYLNYLKRQIFGWKYLKTTKFFMFMLINWQWKKYGL